MRHTLLFVLLVVAESGCAMIPAYTSRNDPITTGDCGAPVQGVAPTAREPATRPPNDVYFGVALSGGGSRAATFSAAVLRELDQLGFLQHVSAISSVSGGSLTGAYYSLSQPHTEAEWDAFQAAVEQDFLRPWLLRLLLPHNLARTLFTRYTRSNLMADVFDEKLFHGHTFADLPARPRLLINASSIGSLPFIFTAPRMLGLRSRLDRYPIAAAVMASGAFPGVFNNVTLANFSTTFTTRDDKYIWGNDPCGTSPRSPLTPASYLHLYDAGATDNLGVDALLGDAKSAAWATIEEGSTLRGCFLVVVDSYVWRSRNEQFDQPDTRRGVDFIVDRNFLDAIETLMDRTRAVKIRELQTNAVPLPRISFGRSFWIVPEALPGKVDCVIWHVTFEAWSFLVDYPRLQKLEDGIARLFELIASIATDYRLTGAHCDAKDLVRALRQAAHLLVREHPGPVLFACDWFKKMFPTSRACPTVPEDELVTLRVPAFSSTPSPHCEREGTGSQQ